MLCIHTYSHWESAWCSDVCIYIHVQIPWDAREHHHSRLHVFPRDAAFHEYDDSDLQKSILSSSKVDSCWLIMDECFYLFETVIWYPYLRVYVPHIHVDLSAQSCEFLPESNQRPRDWQSRALTNWASFTSSRIYTTVDVIDTSADVIDESMHRFDQLLQDMLAAFDVVTWKWIK